ncbi:MFS transporter [Streptomyces sp. ISL-10]|uniref:MFS transporter n=1 Tax=Streptomyces sp. ISL-10 TaxID=2819172 RepID=UPI001BEC8255|nr:MFS transporter [Streptomyces sp. ISL-10]MBT2364782.1 MFS transporter [Streptomyces sp. ISL-10]
MLIAVPCPPGPSDPHVRALTRKLYAYAGLEDFVLLYPVYALLFAENGLTTAEISSLFAIWCVVGLLVEVPSGVWADAVSRRAMMVVGPLLSATGFALWAVTPSYAAYAAGFTLWAVGGALRSGAMEALVHDELARLGSGSRYGRVMGRAAAVSMGATAAATAAAAPALAVGGHTLLWAVSIGSCLLCATVGATLPEHRDASHPAEPQGPEAPEAPEGAAEPQAPEGAEAPEVPEGPEGAGRPGYLATLRAGLNEVRGSRPVRRAMVPAVVITSVWGALDEYVPLLAASTGVAAETVPLLVLVVWVGVTLGSLLVTAGERLSARALGALVAAAAAALAAGALSGAPAGFVLIGAAFLVFQLADVLADVRLQAAITGPSRATVTSLTGLGTNLASLAAFGAYAALSPHVSHGVVFALLALPYVLVAVASARPEPGANAKTRQSSSRPSSEPAHLWRDS